MMRWRNGLLWILALALVKLLIHLLTNGNYGYFRDEYYYIACSERLAWGYVDQPPLSILLLRLSREVLGDSFFGIRILAVLAEAGVVILAGLTARVMGGRPFAQGLAALLALLTPVFLAVSSFYSMNALEHFFWALAIYVLVRIIETDDARLWLLFGLVAGLGLQNKISMLLLGFGVAVGLVLTPQRKYIRSKSLWAGGAIAAVIFLPYVLWQFVHGAPTLEFMANATTYKNITRDPLALMADMALNANPLHVPILLIGLAYLLFTKQGRTFRILGWSFLAIFAALLAQKGTKAYYVGPALPMLFIPGALAIEQLGSRQKLGWLRPVVLLVLLVGGVSVMPLTVPIVPIERYVAYEEWLGLRPPQDEVGHTGEIPQLFSDRFGWVEMTTEVTEVYRSLPAADRSQCAIFAGNYGEAGALEFHGKAHELPPVLSGHNNYWLWGYGDASGEVVLTVGIPRDDLLEAFSTVEHVATHHHEYAVPGERNVPICVCRGPKRPIEELWPGLKIFI
jgi:hypothetical protein